MLKRNWIAAGLIAGMAALGGLALAQSDPSGSSAGSGSQLPPGAQKKSYQQGTATPSQNLRTFTLKVKDVDKEKHLVDFQAKVSPEANISQSGRPISLDQLQKGDEVRAAFDPMSGELVRLDVIKAPRQQQ